MKHTTTHCSECSVELVDTRIPNEWWRKCEECGQFYFLYTPMPHQLRYHQDNARFKLWAGAYGAAKTTTCGAEMVMLALSTPNGVGLVGASTYPQLERTSKKQVLDMIPEEFIAPKGYNKKDNILKLINGYEIMFRSFDDEQKLRSLNLCHAWIEEANGIDFAIFTQLQTRMRHHATDDHKILLSSNPDMNWIRTELLLKSKYIYGAKEKYSRKVDEINPNITSHIARTDQNTHLPKGYIESVAIGKPEWWKARFLEGSFNFSEGSVYPNFTQNIVDMSPDEIRENIRSKGWKVVGAADKQLMSA